MKYTVFWTSYRDLVKMTHVLLLHYSKKKKKEKPTKCGTFSVLTSLNADISKSYCSPFLVILFPHLAEHLH